MFKPDTLNGRSRFGSRKRKIHTAKQTIVNANKVPKLVISPNKEIGVKPGEIAMVLRVAITKKTKSPDLYQIISVLGKQRVEERLEKYLNKMI